MTENSLPTHRQGRRTSDLAGEGVPGSYRKGPLASSNAVLQAGGLRPAPAGKRDELWAGTSGAGGSLALKSRFQMSGLVFNSNKPGMPGKLSFTFKRTSS